MDMKNILDEVYENLTSDEEREAWIKASLDEGIVVCCPDCMAKLRIISSSHQELPTDTHIEFIEHAS